MDYMCNELEESFQCHKHVVRRATFEVRNPDATNRRPSRATVTTIDFTCRSNHRFTAYEDGAKDSATDVVPRKFLETSSSIEFADIASCKLGEIRAAIRRKLFSLGGGIFDKWNEFEGTVSGITAAVRDLGACKVARVFVDVTLFHIRRERELLPDLKSLTGDAVTLPGSHGGGEKSFCAVCLEGLKLKAREVVKTPIAARRFHAKNIRKWRRKIHQYPLCRSEPTLTETAVKENKEREFYAGYSGTTSPPPSSLPLPSFLREKSEKDLRKFNAGFSVMTSPPPPSSLPLPSFLRKKSK
ncbi:unnamed protein product, partial [Cuscuta epithymum]